MNKPKPPAAFEALPDDVKLRLSLKAVASGISPSLPRTHRQCRALLEHEWRRHKRAAMEPPDGAGLVDARFYNVPAMYWLNGDGTRWHTFVPRCDVGAVFAAGREMAEGGKRE